VLKQSEAGLGPPPGVVPPCTGPGIIKKLVEGCKILSSEYINVKKNYVNKRWVIARANKHCFYYQPSDHKGTIPFHGPSGRISYFLTFAKQLIHRVTSLRKLALLIITRIL
jgi:hypothetical protein